MEKYFGNFREISLKFLRNVSKISKKISENFEDYNGEFQKLIHKMLRNILENVENHFLKFRKVSENTINIFKKYFGKFRRILPRKYSM